MSSSHQDTDTYINDDSPWNDPVQRNTSHDTLPRIAGQTSLNRLAQQALENRSSFEAPLNANNENILQIRDNSRKIDCYCHDKETENQLKCRNCQRKDKLTGDGFLRSLAAKSTEETQPWDTESTCTDDSRQDTVSLTSSQSSSQSSSASTHPNPNTQLVSMDNNTASSTHPDSTGMDDSASDVLEPEVMTTSTLAGNGERRQLIRSTVRSLEGFIQNAKTSSGLVRMGISATQGWMNLFTPSVVKERFGEYSGQIVDQLDSRIDHVIDAASNPDHILYSFTRLAAQDQSQLSHHQVGMRPTSPNLQYDANEISADGELSHFQEHMPNINITHPNDLTMNHRSTLALSQNISATHPLTSSLATESAVENSTFWNGFKSKFMQSSWYLHVDSILLSRQTDDSNPADLITPSTFGTSPSGPDLGIGSGNTSQLIPQNTGSLSQSVVHRVQDAVAPAEQFYNTLVEVYYQRSLAEISSTISRRHNDGESESSSALLSTSSSSPSQSVTTEFVESNVIAPSYRASSSLLSDPDISVSSSGRLHFLTAEGFIHAVQERVGVDIWDPRLRPLVAVYYRTAQHLRSLRTTSKRVQGAIHTMQSTVQSTMQNCQENITDNISHLAQLRANFQQQLAYQWERAETGLYQSYQSYQSFGLGALMGRTGTNSNPPTPLVSAQSPDNMTGTLVTLPNNAESQDTRILVKGDTISTAIAQTFGQSLGTLSSLGHSLGFNMGPFAPTQESHSAPSVSSECHSHLTQKPSFCFKSSDILGCSVILETEDDEGENTQNLPQNENSSHVLNTKQEEKEFYSLHPVSLNARQRMTQNENISCDFALNSTETNALPSPASPISSLSSISGQDSYVAVKSCIDKLALTATTTELDPFFPRDSISHPGLQWTTPFPSVSHSTATSTSATSASSATSSSSSSSIITDHNSSLSHFSHDTSIFSTMSTLSAMQSRHVLGQSESLSTQSSSLAPCVDSGSSTTLNGSLNATSIWNSPGKSVKRKHCDIYAPTTTPAFAQTTLQARLPLIQSPSGFSSFFVPNAIPTPSLVSPNVLNEGFGNVSAVLDSHINSDSSSISLSTDAEYDFSTGSEGELDLNLTDSEDDSFPVPNRPTEQNRNQDSLFGKSFGDASRATTISPFRSGNKAKGSKLNSTFPVTQFSSRTTDLGTTAQATSESILGFEASCGRPTPTASESPFYVASYNPSGVLATDSSPDLAHAAVKMRRIHNSVEVQHSQEFLLSPTSSSMSFAGKERELRHISSLSSNLSQVKCRIDHADSPLYRYDKFVMKNFLLQYSDDVEVFTEMDKHKKGQALSQSQQITFARRLKQQVTKENENEYNTLSYMKNGKYSSSDILEDNSGHTYSYEESCLQLSSSTTSSHVPKSIYTHPPSLRMILLNGLLQNQQQSEGDFLYDTIRNAYTAHIASVIHPVVGSDAAYSRRSHQLTLCDAKKKFWGSGMNSGSFSSGYQNACKLQHPVIPFFFCPEVIDSAERLVCPVSSDIDRDTQSRLFQFQLVTLTNEMNQLYHQYIHGSGTDSNDLYNSSEVSHTTLYSQGMLSPSLTTLLTLLNECPTLCRLVQTAASKSAFSPSEEVIDKYRPEESKLVMTLPTLTSLISQHIATEIYSLTSCIIDDLGDLYTPMYERMIHVVLLACICADSYLHISSSTLAIF